MEIKHNVSPELIKNAYSAQLRAYAPYSQFLSGSAVLTESGEIFSAGSVEVAGSTTCCCSLRVAIYKAVSAGHRQIASAATTGDVPGETVRLCGVCRQVLSEFMCQEGQVAFVGKEDVTVKTLKELLPLWKGV